MIKLQYKDSVDVENYLLALSQFVQYPHETWYNEEDIAGFFETDEEDSIDHMSVSVHLNLGSESQHTELEYATLQPVTDLPDFEWLENGQTQVRDEFSPENYAENEQNREALFQNIAEETENEPSFNIVRSIMNFEALNTISNERKREETRKKRLTQILLSQISDEDIEAEVRRMWTTANITTRKRISKRDREAALSNPFNFLALVSYLKNSVILFLALISYLRNNIYYFWH